MMVKQKYMSGFALLEIMIATIILCGLIYMFISFSQNQQRQINSQNVGKHLAIVMNDLIKQTSSTGACVNQGTSYVPLTKCIVLSSGFQTVLKNDGIDPTTATVTITPSS